MRPIILVLALTLVLSCSQPSDATLTPSSASDEASEVVLGSEYTPFDGTFSGNGIGCFVSVTFDKNKARASCSTSVTVNFLYTFVLDKGTITTYLGEYPIIWWFECKRYPYVWDGDSLIITDPVNNRVLTLKKE
jgi:hypothetical protein